MNFVVVPREWENNDANYIQYPSTNPASRDDVASLQKMLDEKLVTRQARYVDCYEENQGFVLLDKSYITSALMRLLGK